VIRKREKGIGNQKARPGKNASDKLRREKGLCNKFASD
jgi:hypothetical protein